MNSETANSDTQRHHLLAILAADVAGYSRLMSLDDKATVAALDAARGADRHIFSMRKANEREKDRIAPLLEI